MHEVVDDPTRKGNILDLILVNDPLIITNLVVCPPPPISNSDHNSHEFDLLTIDYDLPNSNDNIDDTPSIIPIVRYDFANAYWSVLRAALRSADWQFILQSASNAEGVWDSFSKALWQIIDVTVETRISKKTTKGKKYPRHIKRLLDRKLNC